MFVCPHIRLMEQTPRRFDPSIKEYGLSYYGFGKHLRMSLCYVWFHTAIKLGLLVLC